MINIKDIRVVQKYRNHAEPKLIDGVMTIERWVEKTSWSLQIKRDGVFSGWEDVPVIEVEEDS